jgi:hypothetical protein
MRYVAVEFEEQGAPPPPHATAPAEYRPHELEARERGDIQALENGTSFRFATFVQA